MPVIFNRIAAGIPGDVSRKAESTLEPGFVGSAPIAYGSPVKVGADGKFAPLSADSVSDDIYGFLVRIFPTVSAGADFGPAHAPAGAAADVMRRGYMTIALKNGSAAKNGPVYVYTKPVDDYQPGDISATADSRTVSTVTTVYTVAIPGCAFMGAADEGGNTEIVFNI